MANIRDFDSRVLRSMRSRATNYMVVLVQLVRMLACEAGDDEFNSRRSPHTRDSYSGNMEVSKTYDRCSIRLSRAKVLIFSTFFMLNK